MTSRAFLWRENLDPHLPFYLLLTGIGIATGILTGLTGASGMSILISLLLLAGIDIRQIIGLTFVVTLVNAAISVRQYARHGNVNFRTAAWVAGPAIPAVLLGHQLAGRFRPGILTGVMVLFLLVAGIRFLRSPGEPATDAAANGGEASAWWLAIMGSLMGLVMGIMGGGGAVFIGTLLILLFGLRTKEAIGTSVLIMGVAAMPGVVAHALGDTLRWDLLLAIITPSIPAAWVASRVANRISGAAVKRCLGLYLVVISLVLIAKYAYSVLTWP